MAKTLKQIADEIGVSKQRVYRFVKQGNVSEAFQDGNTKYYDESAENFIKSSFTSDETFHEALHEEKDKLNIELQRSQTNNDPDQCQVIEYLIDVTKNVVNVLPGKKITKLLANEPTYVLSG